MNAPLLQATENWRRAFKYGNHAMLMLWRLGLGPIINLTPDTSGQIMVLTHNGRKTGIPHKQPLNYALVDKDVYCVAGFGATSDWYKNIIACPQVQVWLPDGWWEGVAQDISDNPNRVRLIRIVIRASGFAGRLAGIDVNTISDAQLDAITHDYRLIRIHRTAPRTGPDGPGDLAWVWQAATVILFGMLLLKRKH